MAKRNRSSKKSGNPFPEILSLLLKERGMSYREAGRHAGVATSTITNWTSGSHPEDYLAVSRLAKALGVTLSYLLTGQEEKGITAPTISQVFESGDMLFDGYLKVKIEKMILKIPSGEE